MTQREPGAPRALTPDTPWPGLRPFHEEDSAYFFGREAEQQAVADIVQRAQVTVLYGQSGLGKTSLLRAGIGPLVRERGLLPVYLRLDHGNGAEPLTEQLKGALNAALDDEGIRGPRAAPEQSLWEYCHRKDCEFWAPRNRLITPLLVIDQFEEVFTLGTQSAPAVSRVSAFLDALELAIEHRPPSAMRERLERTPEEAALFDFRQDKIKFLFALREDFLPHFDQLRRRMPSLLKQRFRLERMSAAQARSVVRAGGALVTPAVADDIVNFISGSRGDAVVPAAERSVEPALLSVVLDELNRRRAERREAMISADLLAGARESIIHDFYSRAFDGLETAARDWVETHLLTAAGYRDRASVDDGLRAGISERAFALLVDRRVLHREERNGVAWVELTHDLLTGPATQSRDARVRDKASEQAARERQEVERQLARSRRLATVFGLLLMMSAVAMVVAYWQYSRASSAQLSVVAERDRALALETQAIDTARRAEASASSAQTSFASALETADSLGRLVTESLRHDMRMTTAPAVQAVERADGAFSALLERDAESPALRTSYAGFLASAAWSMMESGLIDRAEALLGRPLAVQAQDATEHPALSDRLVAAELMVAKARVFWALGSLNESRALLARATRLAAAIDLGDPRARRVLARIHLIGARLDLLAYQRSQASTKLTAALSVLRQAGPEDREARQMRLQASVGQGETLANDRDAMARFVAADTAIQEALRSTPGDLNLVRLSSEVAMRAGWTSAALGRRYDADEYFNRAVTDARRLVEHDPENLEWSLHLAWAQRGLGNHLWSAAGVKIQQEAQTRVQPLLERQPRWRSPRYLAGVLKYDLADWTHATAEARRGAYLEALSDFERVAASPGDAQGRRAVSLALYQLATVATGADQRRWLGRLDQTLSRLGSLARQDPDFLELRSLASSMMAIDRLSAGDHTAALTHHREASAASEAAARLSRNPEYLRTAAVRLLEEREALEEAGQPAAAEQRYQDAITAITQASTMASAAGSHSLARARLDASTARIQVKAGRTALAVESSERALELVWQGLREAPNHRDTLRELRNLRSSLEALQATVPPATQARVTDLLRRFDSRGPVDWVMRPLFPAQWKNVDSLDTAARYITAPGALDGVRPSQVLAVREAPLTFREGGSIFEVAFETSGGAINLAAVVRTPGSDQDGRPIVVPFRLTGASNNVHEMNRDKKTRLDSPASAEQYVRFFMAMLQGEEGTFALIEAVDEIPWSPGASHTVREDARAKIAPLRLTRAADGHWRGTGTVLYARHLFTVDLQLDSSGMMQMTDDTPVAGPLPVFVERFGNGLRVLETPSQTTIRLSAKTMPTDVDGLSNLARAYADERDWPNAVKVQRRLITALSDAKVAGDRLGGAWLNLSWYSLFARDFRGALTASEAGRRVAPDDIRLDTNRAHALLFLNRLTEAESLYRRHSGRRMANDTLWDDVILDDLRQLEEAGLTHRAMSRVRALLKPSR